MNPSADVRRPNRVRSLDTSWRNMVIELLRAAIGLLVAFVLAQIVAAGAGWRMTAGGYVSTGAVFVALGVVSLFVTSGRPIQRALALQREDIARHEAALTAASARHRFAAQVQEGLDMAENEDQAVAVVGRALSSVHSGPGELLLADSSRAHLARMATTEGGAPGCRVPSPWSCPAVRRGHSLTFGSSRELGVCPRLGDRDEEVAALCVPVTILGTPMGVLHLTSGPGNPPSSDQRALIESVAIMAGTRLGVLRAMASSELAATTDPLTGRLNRRSTETHLRNLHRDGATYAVAFIDLDHFKSLNDTRGHAAGDLALRHLARVVGEAVRDRDVLGRYGGDEFLLVLHGMDAEEAEPVVERVMERLQRSFSDSAVPPFTISVGLADSRDGEEPPDVVAAADGALLEAKRGGRDRLVRVGAGAGAREVASPQPGSGARVEVGFGSGPEIGAGAGVA
jgi:diguanylate cyclase (GGDEF)-like protein